MSDKNLPKESNRCEHGIPWSMECLSCGHSDFVRADLLQQPATSERERMLREALDSIIIRCKDGDRSTDWRSVIQNIAQRAIDSVPTATSERCEQVFLPCLEYEWGCPNYGSDRSKWCVNCQARCVYPATEAPSERCPDCVEGKINIGCAIDKPLLSIDCSRCKGTGRIAFAANDKDLLTLAEIADVERLQRQRLKNPVPDDAWLYVAEINRLLAHIRAASAAHIEPNWLWCGRCQAWIETRHFCGTQVTTGATTSVAEGEGRDALGKVFMDEVKRYNDGNGCTRRQLVDNLLIAVQQSATPPAATAAEGVPEWSVEHPDREREYWSKLGSDAAPADLDPELVAEFGEPHARIMSMPEPPSSYAPSTATGGDGARIRSADTHEQSATFEDSMRWLDEQVAAGWPTDEEAEAILHECGTSGKEATNAFIDRLLHDRQQFKDDADRLRAELAAAQKERDDARASAIRDAVEAVKRAYNPSASHDRCDGIRDALAAVQSLAEQKEGEDADIS